MVPAHYVRYERLVVPALAVPFLDAAVAPLADLPGCTPIVDLACGTGATTAAVLSRHPGRPVLGADLDPRAIRYARQLRPELSWVAGSASGLPFRDTAVGGLVSQQGAQFFPDAEATCRELTRVLHAGGVASLLSWAPDGAAFFPILDDALSAATGSPRAQYVRPLSFDAQAWMSVAGAAGLDVRSLDLFEEPLVVPDITAFVEHFIEPTDAARRRACKIATERIGALLDAGVRLRAARLVLVRS